MAWRLLIDETERTTVVALPQTIEQCLGEAQAKPLIGILLQFDDVQAAVRILDFQGQFLAALEHLEIDQIARTDAVDAQQPIARLETQLLPDRIRLDMSDDRGLGESGSWFRAQLGQGNASGRLIPHRRRATGT